MVGWLRHRIDNILRRDPRMNFFCKLRLDAMLLPKMSTQIFDYVATLMFGVKDYTIVGESPQIDDR